MNWWKIWFSQRKLSWIARLCRAKGCHTPKFHGENFREQSQNCEIREGFLPRKFSAIQYTYTQTSAIKISTKVSGYLISYNYVYSLVSRLYITCKWSQSLERIKVLAIINSYASVHNYVHTLLSCTVIRCNQEKFSIPTQFEENLQVLDIPVLLVCLWENFLVTDDYILQASNSASWHTVHLCSSPSVVTGNEFYLLTGLSFVPIPANWWCAVRLELLLWLSENWFDQLLVHQQLKPK